MARSSTSSFADDYYNYASDAQSDDSYHRKQDSFPLPPRSAPQSHPQPSVKKQASLAQISVPSFSTFRSQTSGIPITATRHRGSLLPSPRPNSFSAAQQASPRIAEPASRPLSLDSPLPRHPSGLAYILTPPLTTETAGKRERLSYAQPPRAHDRSESIDSRLARTESVSSRRTSRRSSIPVHEKYAHEQTTPLAPQISHTGTDTHSQYSLGDHIGHEEDAHMIDDKPAVNLQLEGVQRTLSDDSLLSDKRPKSPSRLGALFGWKSSPTKSGTESPTTTFSDRSSSPVPSPRYQKPLPMEPGAGSRLTPPGLDIGKAQASYFDQPTTPIYLNSSESNAHVQELERELSQVSEELAGSIRREMELEDELERLRLEAPTMPTSEAGRRSSDYFSDSGASSTKFPISDPDAKIEQVERLRRKAEQDKAEVIADNAQRLQTEMTKRRELEQLVQSLEEQMQDKSRNEDERLMLTEKVNELETSLDETKRRLVDEKKAKDNFEDLYSATREELEQRRNERDNLRDEILPRMKERLDGLEAQASDHQALLYENTRMAQELNALKHEQSMFFESQRMSQAGGGGASMFDMIAEENDIVSPIIGGPPRSGLSRSSSLARSSSKTRGSMNRSDSVKGRDGGRQRSGSSGPLSLEAQKEIEDQRDALHKALKLLISRYEKQNKDHQLAMKKLNKEKKAADLRATNFTPKRSQYTREVTFLKEEVTVLRKRTEDALEQKWEYEKGLSGIKMDLDRAEQETRGLRHLLQEQDIVLTSPQAPADPAQDQLSFSISTAKSERDYARRMAEAFRQRALNLQETCSADSTDDNQPPAVAKLFDSANSMDELAEQLDGQVRANSDLRCRLTEAVEKGEREQRESTRQVEEMQKRLAALEDSVLAAAAHSETTLSNHEGEVRLLEEASSPSLKRLEIPAPDQNKSTPASPAMKFAQSPRLPSSAKRLADISSAASLQEASKTQNLERQVREMEFTLREADAEMQRVLQRVQRSQDEVAELTSERDRAVGDLRRLKSMIAEEEMKADAVA